LIVHVRTEILVSVCPKKGVALKSRAILWKSSAKVIVFTAGECGNPEKFGTATGHLREMEGSHTDFFRGVASADVARAYTHRR
jgi:hypothetical protein